MDRDAAAVPLLVAGYLISVAVIARWLPVVRERRTRWLVAHHAGMAAIVVGWALRRPAAVPPNAAWLVASTIWYWMGGISRRRPPSTPGPG